jgi:hypothetical protein
LVSKKEREKERNVVKSGKERSYEMKIKRREKKINK